MTVCSILSAGIQVRGDSVTGGSWGQCFDYTGPSNGTVDLVAGAILNGGRLKHGRFASSMPLAEVSWAVSTPGDKPEFAAGGAQTNPVAALSFGL